MGKAGKVLKSMEGAEGAAAPSKLVVFLVLGSVGDVWPAVLLAQRVERSSALRTTIASSASLCTRLRSAASPIRMIEISVSVVPACGFATCGCSRHRQRLRHNQAI